MGRGGLNSRGGWKIFQILIGRGGGEAGIAGGRCWKIFEMLIAGGRGDFPKL